MEITTPKTPSQEIAQGEYIRRLNVSALNENTHPLEAKSVYGSDVNAMDFKDIKASIHNIEHETSLVYSDLCTQEAHNTKPATAQLHPWNFGPKPIWRIDYSTLKLSSRGQK